MPFYQKGDVRIRYEEAGSGFPLLVTPGGGLNSRVAMWPTAVFNAMEEFKNDFHCITMDQRNANGGESTGPVPVENAWDAFADDQLGLMDHLGIREFFYMGYCIGGCFVGKLLQRAPDRVVAAVFCQSVGEGSASSRQREKGEHTLGSEEKGELIPRQLPVNLDICHHEIGGIIVTRERATECVANRTVGAVAGDKIGDVGRFLSAVGRLKRCAHPVFVLLERNKFNTPFHLCAESRQIAGHHTLCLTLWQLQNEGKG